MNESDNKVFSSTHHNQSITLEPDYRPNENEDYMNDKQIEYFKLKLLIWKEELLRESGETLVHLKEKVNNSPDFNDRASDEMETAIELRTRDRYRKLLDKIDAALVRIEKKEYGYCEESGEEIGIRRLEARPVATFSIEVQEKLERLEKQHAEDKIEG